MKGNFAWGSYGGFSAGSWKVLGTFLAESRQDLGKMSLPLAVRSLGSPKEAKGCQKAPKESPKVDKGSQKGGQWEPLGEAKQSFWKPNSVISCYFWASFFDRFWKVRGPISAEDRGREPRQGTGTLGWGLARRPLGRIASRRHRV